MGEEAPFQQDQEEASEAEEVKYDGPITMSTRIWANRAQLLRDALRANDISIDWNDWKDSQALGQAVRKAARMG